MKKEERGHVYRCASCRRVVSTLNEAGYFQNTSGVRMSSNGIEWKFVCRCKSEIKIKLTPR